MPLPRNRIYIDNLPEQLKKDIPESKHIYIKPSAVYKEKFQCELHYSTEAKAKSALDDYSTRWKCGENHNAPQIAFTRTRNVCVPGEFQLWRVFFNGICMVNHKGEKSPVSHKDFDALINFRDKYANPSVVEPSTKFRDCSQGYVDFNMEDDKQTFLGKFRWSCGIDKPVEAVLLKGAERGKTTHPILE